LILPGEVDLNDVEGLMRKGCHHIDDVGVVLLDDLGRLQRGQAFLVRMPLVVRVHAWRHPVLSIG
jgi:hypothetical protein